MHCASSAPAVPPPACEAGATAAVLHAFGETAGKRLSLSLRDALARVAEQLQGQGERAAAALEQAALLEAAQFARSRQPALVEDFRRCFAQRHARACRPRSSLLAGFALDVDVGQLRVLADAQLEEGLDAGDLCEAIRSRCAGAFYSLAEPYRSLLGDPDLQPADLPIGPRSIAQALTDALDRQFSRIDTKQRLLRALCRDWPKDIEAVLRGLPACSPAPATEAVNAEPASADHAIPYTQPLVEEQAALDDPRAMAAACEAVAHATAGRQLPRVILTFLQGPWQLLLARIRATPGEQMDSWQEAVRTMQDLVWSLSLRNARTERERLVALLPDLVRRLQAGLQRLGAAEEQRTAFFASLAKYHLKLVNLSGILAGQDALRGEAGTAPAEALPGRPQPGAWLEFDEPDGGRLALELSWMSAAATLYLFTDRHGRRALSLSAVELDRRLREGTARTLAAAPTAATGGEEPD